ncbi:NAD(P)-dependent oxidoreductase [Metarhizobium album]|uniref:NAD(P)-dependent oxidoreductase n=1 Tax=Metarhizobium album TaxID=2182425 RepID=A0A2U2DWN3_9HYPH|nr:NAD(P)-dependent oxidoreductase [Rhizobium album]PWE57720.1 NAD(P)-dependent oxidoreductase [Rhizobium album]
MKVLLTGAGGFIGRHVLDALDKQGIETIAVGRRKPDGCPDSAFERADLLEIDDFDAFATKLGATHLLHLAWYAEHGKYWNSPLNLRWCEATTRLVEAFCKAGGRHVVMAGTCAEYDWSYGYCREAETPINPATLYGSAKDATRRLAMAVCREYDVPCAWGRIFLAYGAGEAPQRLVPSLIEIFQDKRSAFAVDQDCFRDFLHVADVASAFTTLLLKGANGIYNVGSGEPVQLADVVRWIADILDGDAQRVLSLRRDKTGQPLLLLGENLKLKELGWQPVIPVKQGLSKIIAGNIHELADMPRMFR